MWVQIPHGTFGLVHPYRVGLKDQPSECVSTKGLHSGGFIIKMEIKNRYTNKVIFECEAESIKVCVEKAVKNRVDLSEADLNGADLKWADLSEANLSEANLSEADLRWVNLSEANLSEADLNGADLSEADLWRANLSKADLNGANLSKADLWRANLSEADLWRANLSEADLSKANLNAIYYNTKVTAKQKRQIVESDLFEVIDSTS